MRTLAQLLWGAAGLGLALSLPRSAAAQEEQLDPAFHRSVTIAVVRDGPSPGDTLFRVIAAELESLLGTSGAQVSYKNIPAFDAGWDAERMEPALRSALRDPEVDLILTTGLLITQAATRIDLTKPVVSAYLQRSDLYRVADLDGDRSLKENLSFLLIAQRAASDIAAVADLVLADSVYVVLDEEFLRQYRRIDQEIGELEGATGAELAPLPIGLDIDASLARVPAGAKAALLASTPRLSLSERERLIAGLTARGVATLSLQGHDEVHLGALAARTPNLITLVARRVALNLSELIRGAAARELPVLVSSDPRLLVNARTAVALGWRPTLEVQSFATFLHPEALRLDEEPLPFSDALRQAALTNPSLAADSQQVETALRDKQLLRSPMLPQINFQPSFLAMNPAGLEDLIPERLLSASFSAQQMIYDDRTISDFRSSSRLYESSQQSFLTRRYNVYERAGVAYLRVSLARVLYRIELANLRLTEENLELAKFRVDVGYSGRDEVFRWEAQLATSRSDLFRSIATIETERVRLNQTLGVPQGERYRTEEIEVSPDSFPLLNGQLTRYTNDARAIDEITDFSVAFGLANAPELRAIGKNIEAQQIQLGQRKRAWYLPSFFLNFRFDYWIEREPSLPGVDPYIPRVELAANYPIFLGGARSYDVSRSRAQVTRLQEQQRSISNLVERRIRTSAARINSSFPTIKFSQIAAENARRNLEIVQDQYAQGLVNVTDLLSAQTESLRAEQAAAAATYLFLIDLLSFQRAVAWFEFEKTDEERDQLLQRITQYIEDAER